MVNMNHLPGVALTAAGLVGAAAVTRRARRAKGVTKGPVMVGASVEKAEFLSPTFDRF